MAVKMATMITVATVKRMLGALTLCVAGVGLPAYADGLIRVEQTIFGMDCAPCAYGIEQGLKKLRGIDDVQVSLNKGLTTIALSQDSPTTLEKIRQVVRDNGFTPKAARVVVVGTLERTNNASWLKAAGLPRYRIVPASDAIETALSARQGEGTVRVEGVVPEASEVAQELHVDKLDR